MKISIFVKTMSGGSQKYDIDTNNIKTAGQLAQEVAKNENMQASNVQLVYAGKALMASDNLEEKGVENMTTMFVVYRLEGGL